MRRTFGGQPPSDEELAAGREITELDRTLAAFDGGDIVATAGIFSYEMTVPGRTLPCGGVTRVTVLPTHRRRGILTAMMRQQLDDMRERGEPVAALFASEAPIYGRFGYGLSTYQADLELERFRSAFREAPDAGGRITLVDLHHAVEAFAQVWDDARRDQPGTMSLNEGWWRYELADLETSRHGATPEYRVLYEQNGRPTGFALYRIKMDWNASGPAGTMSLRLLIASTAEAYAALWHYVLNVDLVVKVTAHQRPVDEPLRFLLADSRQPKTRIEDGIWLRLVDVAGALAGRRYGVDGRLTLHVSDAFCPWNESSYELEAEAAVAQCGRSQKSPDLEIDAADLAAAYLGGNRFRVLQQAGRVVERRAGSVARADLMFAADRAPWCPSHF